jgi:hypothetical protein
LAQVTDHLSVAEPQAGYRGSQDVALARHYQLIWQLIWQVIWLLSQGRTVSETARLTGFVPRCIKELLVRYNAFGRSSPGDRRRGNGAKPVIPTAEVLDMPRARVTVRTEPASEPERDPGGTA